MPRAREVALPTYRVVIGPGLIERLGEIVGAAAPAHRYAIVTDTNVGPLYAERARYALAATATSCTIFTVPAGEAQKTRDTWGRLTDDLLTSGFGRDTTVIALGGGVVGDVAGFVAATYMRGVPFVQVPTSLLAMIDASVGGKTGVDTPAGKNLVGAFHQPAAVVADTTLLATLPADHLRAGMAEAIKHGVIADADYFASVERLLPELPTLKASGDALLDLVARSVEIKADIVRRDEREGGVRKTLNFGHTIGHAVERCTDYAMLHGDAVAIGMVHEAMLGERLGVTARGTTSRIRTAIRAAALPEDPPASISADEILDATRGDKKARAGRVEYALPAAVGTMAAAERGWAIPVADDVVRAVLA